MLFNTTGPRSQTGAVKQTIVILIKKSGSNWPFFHNAVIWFYAAHCMSHKWKGTAEDGGGAHYDLCMLMF